MGGSGVYGDQEVDLAQQRPCVAEAADAIAEAGWREVIRAHTLRQHVERVIGEVRAAYEG